MLKATSLLTFFLLSFCSGYSQSLIIAGEWVFPELKIDKSFPNGSYLLCGYNDELYILQSCKRPHGMDHDSVVLLRFTDGKLSCQQQLQFPKNFEPSYLRSFCLTDSFLFFTDNNGVFIFKTEKSKYIFSDFVYTASDYRKQKAKYGLFQVWHYTANHIYSTDFSRSDAIGGYKDMHIGYINNKSLEPERAFHIPICGTSLSIINATYPFAVNRSGNALASADILSHTVNVYKLDPDSIEYLFGKDVSDTSWAMVNEDSMKIWSRVLEIYNGNFYEARSKIMRAVFSSPSVNRLTFLNDSILLVGINGMSEYLFKTVNIHSRETTYLNKQEGIDLISWQSYMSTVHNGAIYILTPNRILAENSWNAPGETTMSTVGWKLVKVSVSEE